MRVSVSICMRNLCAYLYRSLSLYLHHSIYPCAMSISLSMLLLAPAFRTRACACLHPLPCVCVCVCENTYTYLHYIYIYIYIHTHTHTHTYMHTYIHTYIHTGLGMLIVMHFLHLPRRQAHTQQNMHSIFMYRTRVTCEQWHKAARCAGLCRHEQRHGNVSPCVCLCMYVCMYVCMYLESLGSKGIRQLDAQVFAGMSSVTEM